MNLGRMKKHGVDVEAEFSKTTPTNLSYFVKGIVGFNENRIISKDDLPYAPEHVKESGKPLGAQLLGVVLTGGGYYTSVNDIHINPSPIELELLCLGDYKYLDYTADGQIMEVDKYSIKGNAYPPITYSFQSGFAYKGFNLNFMFQGNYGKYVEFNQIYAAEFNDNQMRIHAAQLDYWRPDNPDATHSALHVYTSDMWNIISFGGGGAARGYYIRIKDHYWRDASYVRLKDVYVGYNFSSGFMSQLLGESRLTAYVTANNLFTITALIEGDPESKSFSTGFFPQLTTVLFGLKIDF